MRTWPSATSVAKDKTETIGQGKTLNVTQHYQTNSKSMKTAVVQHHAEEIGSRTSTIKNAHVLNVGDSQSVNVGASHTMSVRNNVHVGAGDEIALVCGHASITLKKDGTILINGVTVESSASGSHSVRGKTVTSSATGEHTVEGTILKLNP